MLFGSIEQTQLILSKRAEDYQLALRAPNQLKIFLLVKHIYSYPAELKKFSLLEHFLLKIKYINRLRLCLLIRYSLRFYISHIPLDRFILLILNITGALVFSFLDDIHRLEHLVPYYHYFQEGHAKAKIFFSNRHYQYSWRYLFW